MQAEVKELVAIHSAIAAIEKLTQDKLAPMKQRRDALQSKITEELTKFGVLSQRFQEATVSRLLHQGLAFHCCFPCASSQAVFPRSQHALQVRHQWDSCKLEQFFPLNCLPIQEIHLQSSFIASPSWFTKRRNSTSSTTSTYPRVYSSVRNADVQDVDNANEIWDLIVERLPRWLNFYQDEWSLYLVDNKCRTTINKHAVKVGSSGNRMLTHGGLVAPLKRKWSLPDTSRRIQKAQPGRP